MKPLLTDEQIEEMWESKKLSDDIQTDIVLHVKLLLKAQYQAIVTWLFEPCTEHYNSGVSFYITLRKDCPECMAELKKEVDG